MPRWVAGRLPRPFGSANEPDGGGDRQIVAGGEPVLPSPLRRSYPGGLAPEGGVSIRLPGFNFIPRGAIKLDEYGELDYQLNGGFGPLPIIIQDIPAGLQLRLTGIGFGGDDESVVNEVTWSLLKTQSVVTGSGGEPQQGDATRYTQKPAGIGSLDEPTPIDYVIDGKQFAMILLTFPTPTLSYSVHIVCRLLGYYFMEAPEMLEAQNL